MSKFTDFESFQHVLGTYKTYVLTKNLVWEIGKKDSGWELVIPKGTPFDISVPPYLEWAQDPHDRDILLAAAIHDVLLRRGFGASFSSSEFRRAALARGAPRIKSWVLWLTTLLATVKNHQPSY